MDFSEFMTPHFMAMKYHSGEGLSTTGTKSRTDSETLGSWSNISSADGEGNFSAASIWYTVEECKESGLLDVSGLDLAHHLCQDCDLSHIPRDNLIKAGRDLFRALHVVDSALSDNDKRETRVQFLVSCVDGEREIDSIVKCSMNGVEYRFHGSYLVHNSFDIQSSLPQQSLLADVEG